MPDNLSALNATISGTALQQNVDAFIANLPGMNPYRID